METLFPVEMKKIRESIAAETLLQEGISLSIENEGGEVFFRTHDTLIGGPHALGCSALHISLKNKGGNIYFEPVVASSTPPAVSSWFTGGWAKAVVVAGLVYVYRAELRILGHGALAGANLAVERWEGRRGRRGGGGGGKKKGGEEEKTSGTQTEDEGTTEQTLPDSQMSRQGNASTHTPVQQQPQAPHGTYTVSTLQSFDPRSPAYPAPHYLPLASCLPNHQPVQSGAPARAPASTAHIRQVVQDRAVQENHRRIADRLERGVYPFGRFDSENDSGPSRDVHQDDGSGFDADMYLSEEESVYCGGVPVVRYQTRIRDV